MIMFNTMGEEGFRSGLNTMPRLLETTDDRVKFIAAVRSPVARDVLNFDVRARKIIIQGEINKMSITMRSKLQTMLKDQEDEAFLKAASLPKVPKHFSGPVINQVQNQVRQNHFVVTNDAHIRATNNGYKRNELGGFFAH